MIKSVLAMQSKDCNSVSEQLMAAGRSEEEVQKVSKIMAHTVHQLEAESSPPEHGPEARSLPCEEMSTDHEFSAGEPNWCQHGH